jgi:tetratricopeptide (TPR) repeat protein
MAHDVFLSYASEDKKIADGMCATLEGKKIRCWIAPRDVLPGVSYAEAIVDAINECQLLVLIFSSNANASPHVKRELERAVSKGKAIIPFRIEDVPLAKDMELYISATHWLDALTPPLQNHLEHLADTVQLLLGRTKKAEEKIATERESKPSPPEKLDINASIKSIQHQNAASKLRKEGKYKEAIEEYNKALSIDPKFALAYTGRGVAYHILGQHESAIEDHSEAIRINPNDALFYYNRGRSFQELSKHRQAIENFDEGIRINPNDAKLYYSRGFSFQKLSKHQQAIEDFKHAIRLNPGYALAYNARGVSFHSQGKYEIAIKDFKQALRIDPKDVTFSKNLKNTESMMNLKGKSFWQKFTKRGKAGKNMEEKTKSILHHNSATKLQKEGKYKEAINEFNKALSIDPKFAMAYASRGVTFHYLGEYTTAIKDYSQAIRINPSDATFYNNRGASYQKLEKHQQAIEDFDQAIRIDPKHAPAYNGRGVSFMKLKEYQRAIEDFDQAIRIDPNDPTFAENRKWTEAIMKGMSDVEDYLRRMKEGKN